MPEATSFNIGSSPLNALFGTGAAGVAAQAEDGNPHGFQATLAAQTGPATAPGMEQNAGAGLFSTPTLALSAAPPPSALTAAPTALALSAAPPPPAASDPASKAAPAPVVATMTALRNNGAAMNGADIVAPETGAAAANAPIVISNGNLPVGGKILPVPLAPPDSEPDTADPSADAAPATAPDTIKPMLAKAAAPRPRKPAAEPDEQDAAPATAQAEKAVAETRDDTGDQDTPAAMAQTMTPDAPMPPAITPDAPVPGNAAPAVMLSINPPAQPAPTAGNAAPRMDEAAGQSAISGVSAIAPAALAARTPVAATMTAAPLQRPAAPADPAAAMIDPSAPALATGAVWPAGLPQTGEAVTQARAPIASLTPAPLASAKTTARLAKPADADLSASTEDPVAARQAGTPLPPTAAAAMQGGASPAADTITDTTNSALTATQPSGETTRIAAPSPAPDTGVSRDMSALVDRLVETRAAMRSGAPAQWVQTSIQHVEFGRVALQIRQDGDNLSVAMASNDPGFAPAAQAALNGSQSLLQPAAASRSSADTDQNSGQNSGQNQGQNSHSGSQPGGQFTGQFNGQSGGQHQQPATRQQAPFANTTTAAQQGHTPGDTAGSAPQSRAPSSRSGILA
ncbi:MULTISPECIES: hypothetical protein [unclassified Novosphingobium]|uniref:hypothetical protein n=1 Tax=unclassified Novosphingobium TaxID=2644732 RepID=UPI00086F7C23|nr:MULTISPECIES: hypothetical protein [unclassified Novosphingobium]MBN9143212.1 hypothetical protein [Novosphingobium sp.]MDR6706300.1 Meckel syndrome type 1 protein [Novosphingobium sp. 1748]ODU82693.1 MAG: hypothetical protein ABT10_09770 [Novosphingobium sp. SCN 63-17]OJX89537.1 MAG: hypothetical protein BGP00_15155 [Novosphingobium sp. 63-713]